MSYNYDANITPSYSSDNHIEWDLGTVIVGEVVEIVFSAHADYIGVGYNIAEVTTCESANDNDNAYVIVAGMIIEKEVWDPNLEAWVEEIDASVGETITFKITIFYYGNGSYNLYNIHVKDELPECLDYAYNAIPSETHVSGDGRTIWWNLSISICAGGFYEIFYDAIITETSGCGPCINWAKVWANECSGEHFYWEDPATINAECPLIADSGGPYFGEIDEYILISGTATGGNPPYSYAWDLDDDGSYDDSSSSSFSRYWTQDGTYTISLRVTDDVGRIDFDDTTVTIEPMDNNPPVKPVKPSGLSSGDIDVSYTYSTSSTDPNYDNIRYGWDWNNDGVVDEWTGYYSSSSVISTSHSWSSGGIYYIKVKAEDEYGAQSDFSTSLMVTVTGNNAPNKPSISGPSSGKSGNSYTYTTSTSDPEGDQVYYWFDWDDGTNTGWLGPYSSGQSSSASHIWTSQGSYSIKVKSKDENGVESVWSNPLSISMPKEKTFFYSFLFKIFENNPYIYTLIEQILNLLEYN